MATISMLPFNIQEICHINRGVYDCRSYRSILGCWNIFSMSLFMFQGIGWIKSHIIRNHETLFRVNDFNIFMIYAIAIYFKNACINNWQS